MLSACAEEVTAGPRLGPGVHSDDEEADAMLLQHIRNYLGVGTALDDDDAPVGDVLEAGELEDFFRQPDSISVDAPGQSLAAAKVGKPH
jgi:hypothetical protein